MKHTDIEAIMTAKVAEYAANGYILSAATMSGHQGEIAKVDLKKGNEIIRILLTSESCWDDEGTIQKTVLTVGRAQKQIRMNRPFDTMCATIWNNELDIIEELTWYSVDSSANYFSADKAEIIAQHDKQMRRYRVRSEYRENRVRKDVTSDAAKAAVLPFIRRQNRCGKMKAENITKIVKYYSCEYDKMHYSITLTNNKSYKLA